MRTMIIAVGRARAGPLRELYDDYAARISSMRAIGPVELREVEERKRLPAAELKPREAGLMRAALPKDAIVVALDARGQALSSEAFAARLAGWRNAGVQNVAFLIGGADGLDDPLVRQADLVLSLGAMTWPHMLVRVMLAEQLYRASTILQGHPYHRA